MAPRSTSDDGASGGNVVIAAARAAGTTINSDALLQELQQENDFFDSVVDMIPTKLYVPGQSGDDYNPKYFKGQAKESKEARRAKAKQSKRAKLDPSQAETTTQAQRRLQQEKQGAPQPPVPPSAKPAEKSDPTASAPPTAATSAASASSSASRIEALRAKLHARLAEQRSNRPEPNQVSKRAARKAEKKRRREEAVARKRKKANTNSDGNQAEKNFTVGGGKNVDPAQDLATVDFGLLAGLNSNAERKSSGISYITKTNKSLANLNKTKNLQKLIADAEAKKEKLEALQKGSEEDQVKAQNMQWSDTITAAAGDRVKDDPAKLKKALKRKVAQKTKSARAWKARTQQTAQAMQERQQIRTHNLGQRKAGGSTGANLSKKRIVTPEDEQKKRPRAGFEGRKKKFLNNGKKE